MTSLTFKNPGRLPESDGYSHVASAEGIKKLVYISGQTVKQGDLYEQTSQILKNITEALKEEGAQPSDIIKIGIFVKDYDKSKWPIIKSCLSQVFDVTKWPASTLLGVQNLCEPEYLIEIEAMAVI